MHLLQFYAILKSVIADLTVHQRLTLQRRTEQKILLSSVVYRTEDSLVFNCLHELSYLTKESPLKENAEFLAANTFIKNKIKRKTHCSSSVTTRRHYATIPAK